jgi:secreted trypsin-like serine protease
LSNDSYFFVNTTHSGDRAVTVINLLNVWYLQRNSCHCSVSWMCGIYKEIAVIAQSPECVVFTKK